MQNLKIVIRYLKSQWKYSFLNILGLSLGLILAIMMIMLIHYELSFDGFHPQKENIYQICTHDLKSGEFLSHTPCPLPRTLKNDYPEVKNVTGIWKMLYKEAKIEYNGLTYSGFTGASVESDVFSMFDYNLVLGKKETILEGVNSIAVSESFARKVFGTENPVGKKITVRNYDFIISGIYKDLPENSALNFDVLFSDKIRKVTWEKFPIAWWSGGIYTYVILGEYTNYEHFNKRLKEIPDKYFPDFLKGRETFFLEPFKKIHFKNSILGGLVPAVSPVYLIILGSIAFITLLIACINFINLATCQATKRNKDIGIRKIVGAKKSQIVSLQIWSALIIAGVSILIALPVSYVLLPFFEQLTQRPLSGQFLNPVVIVMVILTVLLIAIITGYVPGLFYAKISAIRALSFRIKKGSMDSSIKNAFTIFQLSLAVLLIISQLLILKQLRYMRNANLGFNNENLLAIPVYNIDEENYNRKYQKAENYKNEIEKYGAQFGYGKGVITENIPGYYYQNSFTLHPVGGKIDECLVTSTAVDEYFLDVYEISVVKGRFFSKEIRSDRNAFMINETLMKQIGWESIDNKKFRWHHEGGNMPVIGVLKDIHTTSLKEPIGPMVYRFGQHNNSPGFITFRINEGKIEETIAFMKKKWKEMFPEIPFMHFDVKEKYFQNYNEEVRLSKIIGSFALMAIVLSALGLIGLITFFSEQRIKEIGIRKVNGAKVREILAMLNADFVKWVIIAFIIACPLAWYAMNKWLENFAYKTEISWWIFALAGGIALVIALLTVSWQSFRAARRNPVEALRYE